MHIRRILPIVLLAATAGIGAPPKDGPAARLAARNNRFGFEILTRLHKEGENVFLSPLSIASALQMTSGAAEAETRAEMVQALHVDDVNLLEGNRALLDACNASEDVRLAVANSIWANEGEMKLNGEFAEECAKFYSAEVRQLSFRNPATLGTINGWVGEKTAGKIPNLLDSVSEDATGYLINAIHFKGAWRESFAKEATKDEDFTLVSGEKLKVRMMRQGGSFPYARNDRFEAVGLLFGERRSAAMWFLVPAKGKTLADVVLALDGAAFGKVAESAWKRGTVAVPRFKLRYKEDLVGALKELGISRAFERASAQFGRFGSNGGRGFFISRVLHEAVLEVDEEGAEAAAATAVELEVGSAMPDRETPFAFVADRPFLVAITDRATGAVLFLGTVYSPESR
jgi:serpin B